MIKVTLNKNEFSIKFTGFKKKEKPQKPYVMNKGNTTVFVQEPKVGFEILFICINIFFCIFHIFWGVTPMGLVNFCCLIFFFLSYQVKMKPWREFLSYKEKERILLENKLKEEKEYKEVLDEINFVKPREIEKNA